MQHGRAGQLANHSTEARSSLSLRSACVLTGLVATIDLCSVGGVVTREFPCFSFTEALRFGPGAVGRLQAAGSSVLVVSSPHSPSPRPFWRGLLC